MILIIHNLNCFHFHKSSKVAVISMSLSFVIIIVVDNCQNHNKTGEKNVNIGEH